MTTGDAAVKIRDVSHQFGEPGDPQFVRALLDTSLDITRGELLCLIGPSGCGKSTLLNMIGGLLTQSSGTVEVNNKPVRGPLPRDIAGGHTITHGSALPLPACGERVGVRGLMTLDKPVPPHPTAFGSRPLPASGER